MIKLRYISICVFCVVLHIKLINCAYNKLGMTIGPRLYGHPQKIPTIGRVKSRFMGLGLGIGNYLQL